jgi:hypothetical protein
MMDYYLCASEWHHVFKPQNCLEHLLNAEDFKVCQLDVHSSIPLDYYLNSQLTNLLAIWRHDE